MLREHSVYITDPCIAATIQQDVLQSGPSASTVMYIQEFCVPLKIGSGI